ALDGAAGTTDRGGGDDALRGAADAQQHVDAAIRDGGLDAGRDVAVGDELDACAGGADLLQDLRVAGAVEDDDRHFGDCLAESFRDFGDVIGHRRFEVYYVGRGRADGDLVHIEDARGHC